MNCTLKAKLYFSEQNLYFGIIFVYEKLKTKVYFSHYHFVAKINKIFEILCAIRIETREKNIE